MVFWPDPTSDDYSTVLDSGNEFCTEVIGTEKWVRDYENCEENNEEVVPTGTPTTEWGLVELHLPLGKAWI